MQFAWLKEQHHCNSKNCQY